MLQSRILAVTCLAVLSTSLAFAQSGAATATTYNTVKQKLAQGKQVFGGTVLTSDPETYCAMANAGWDFLWIEMQHSPLTYSQVAHMIRSCKGAPGIPFIRVPDATEG
ncbi:MAG: hypothetical protein AB7O65_04045, partial [Candidatus Korobacteraceae bacterium]